MKRILIVLLLVALLLPLCSCGKGDGGATTASIATDAGPAEETELKCTVRLTEYDRPVSTYTELQTAYLDDKTENATDYAGGVDELSRPAPIALRWDVDFEAGEKRLRYFVVRIWTKADGSDARSFLVGRSEREYLFENAYVGQRYCWDVTAIGTDGIAVRSAAGSFETEDRAFRFLSVDGVTNVRDLGGKRTEDGGRVRQGLLIRGARLNDNGSVEPLITDEGVKTMLQTLGIKTELDLRKEDEVGAHEGSFLGEGVNQLVRPLRGGLDITNGTVRSSLKKIFAVLADEDNYPIFFHCAAGADRTGIVAWLVNALCGVSKDDLWRDYLFTNFGDIGGNREQNGNGGAKKNYVNVLDAASGNTYQKKVYDYLKNEVGIPAKDLDAVIRIMKIAPGTTVEYGMPPIPAGHAHTPENTVTVIETPSCSCPGIQAKYCAVCGEFVEGTVAELPIDPDGHRADWTVTRQPTLLDQADGSRNGVCTECGRFVEQTIGFAPQVARLTDQSYGKFSFERINIADAVRGGHFYPTANNPSGNDLLIEYSVFYNRTMLNFASDCNAYATTRINGESVIYWSPSNDIPSSWCRFAGGFEGTGDNFKNPVSDSEVTTSAKIMEAGGEYTDYPNIGGDDPNNPAYGWHRIGIRIHEELTNAAALKKDTTAGKTKAKYVLTVTVYFDGAAVYKLKTDDSATPMRSTRNLLYFAASDGKGGIVYTDIAADRYVIPFELNATNVQSGKKVNVATADAFVSCGKDFVMRVEKLASPTASTLTISPDLSVSAPIYYRLK